MALAAATSTVPTAFHDQNQERDTSYCTAINFNSTRLCFDGMIYNQTNKPNFATASVVSNRRQTQKPSGQFQGNRSSCSFTAKMVTLCAEGRLKEAMVVFHDINQKGFRIDVESYASLLQACAHMQSLIYGKQVHTHMVDNGIQGNAYLDNILIAMYAKCESPTDARQVFDKMSKPDAFCWNVMIGGYASSGHFKEALTLYYQMLQAGTRPDSFTFPRVLKACSALAALQQGKEIHHCIIKSGFESYLFVGNALVAMYSKCGCIDDAFKVFDKMSQRDVVSWNTMITAYAQNGYFNEALKLFCQMHFAGVDSSSVTIASVLPACANLTALQCGKEIHGHTIRTGIESNVFVENAFVTMYAKCGSLEDARRVFDKMSQRDLVSWTAMIAGYAQNAHCDEALKLFWRMQLADVKVDSVTIASVLSASARLAVLHHGKGIHNYILKSKHEPDVLVGNALIDMYAKCGSIKDARLVFDNMSQRNVISWTAMIAGYGIHGHGEKALALFHQMQQAGVQPNHITFTALLSACSHAGLVNAGWQYFNRMNQEYCITPGAEHYACMVDLLGRAGHLDEAHDFIKNMPLEPTGSVWGALLGACRIHSNVKLGESLAKRLFELEPENTGNYVLLSNIYAVAGRWNEVAEVRTMMSDRGLTKMPGCSWIEVKNKVHTFLIGDISHPQSDKIYATLETLTGQLKEAGYVPDIDFVLHNVDEAEKEHILCGHSEKLAIAFGLMNTCSGSPIRVTKNLRVCGDCHSATKFISKVVAREIIVRDNNRFHHFKDGLCSCGDYWWAALVQHAKTEVSCPPVQSSFPLVHFDEWIECASIGGPVTNNWYSNAFPQRLLGFAGAGMGTSTGVDMGSEPNSGNPSGQVQELGYRDSHKLSS
eukprot:Gb_03440 [translate_table: standard]